MDFWNAIRLSHGTGIVGRHTTGEYFEFTMNEDPVLLDPKTGERDRCALHTDHLNFLMAADFFPVKDWAEECRRYKSKSLRQQVAALIGNTGGVKAAMDFLNEDEPKTAALIILP